MGAKKKTRKGSKIAGRIRADQDDWVKRCMDLPTEKMPTTLVCAGVEVLQASCEGMSDLELMKTLHWLANGRQGQPPGLGAAAARKLLRAAGKSEKTAQQGTRSKKRVASR